jgi:uridine kinase
MRELVNKKIPFIKKILSIEEAKEIFSKTGRLDRFRAIEYRKKPYVTIYNCDGYEDYFYGYMVPDTGYLKKFALKFYETGLIMISPDKTNPDIIPKFKEQKKLFTIFKEY